MGGKAVAVLGAACLVVGILLGVEAASKPAPIQLPPKTIVKTEEVVTEVKVPIVPDSCRRVASLAGDMHAVVSRLEDDLARQDQVIDLAARGILGKDMKDLNAAKKEQRSIKTDSTADIQRLVALKKEFDEASAECKFDID